MLTKRLGFIFMTTDFLETNERNMMETTRRKMNASSTEYFEEAFKKFFLSYFIDMIEVIIQPDSFHCNIQDTHTFGFCVILQDSVVKTPQTQSAVEYMRHILYIEYQVTSLAASQDATQREAFSSSSSSLSFFIRSLLSVLVP